MIRSIYLATSWKNQYYHDVLRRLRADGHNVYDFRQDGFGWQEVDPDWKDKFGNHRAYLEALEHPRSIEGFHRDFNAMEAANTVVLLTPCGRSAHMELGWMVAAAKDSYVLLTDPQEWDLMYKMVNKICLSTDELLQELAQ